METKSKNSKLQVLFFIFVLGVLVTSVLQGISSIVCPSGCNYTRRFIARMLEKLSKDLIIRGR